MPGKCKDLGCTKQAVFGFVGDIRSTCCFKHKLDGMINIMAKKCIFNNCKKQPNFGLPSDKLASHCFEHKLENMVDVKHKPCKYYDCKTRPNFGFKNDKSPSHCFEHKLENMVDLVHKKCIFDDCQTRPNFGFKNDKLASHCFEHKLENMVDLTHKLCKYCNYTRAWINGYCSSCFYQLNPDHSKTRNHKTRENAFMVPLKEKYKDMVLDKAVSGGCSKKRPDGLIDLYTHSIIVEIDESQHAGYSCEEKRLMLLFQDLGNRPLVMIRLNPDSYTVDGKRYMGAFSLSKTTGTLQVKKNEFNLRYSKLLETIEMCHEIPDKEITVIELFMNQ